MTPESGNQTRATLMGGECSHHCAIPAPQKAATPIKFLATSVCNVFDGSTAFDRVVTFAYERSNCSTAAALSSPEGGRPWFSSLLSILTVIDGLRFFCNPTINSFFQRTSITFTREERVVTVSVFSSHWLSAHSSAGAYWNRYKNVAQQWNSPYGFQSFSATWLMSIFTLDQDAP